MIIRRRDAQVLPLCSSTDGGDQTEDVEEGDKVNTGSFVAGGFTTES